VVDLQKEADDDIYEGFNNPAFRPQVDAYCVLAPEVYGD
jgi:hypothetical protein